ncbi:helix-turn-helix domain-containing protein [Clostridium sp. HBUAS56017]|uniref:helix-turn-helix transcriptional regulator n=1 Tax=Clostridium sp. HBUAS56017 TaxID=2571128 RepID=UPI001178BFC2|nr:helix-turn-helix domain-containing protein [Clostridium sp. HBUAS56017]
MKNKIHEIIIENGLKVSYVIRKAGLAKSSFYEIMRGKAIPSLANARKISQALNKPLDEVFPNDNFKIEGGN